MEINKIKNRKKIGKTKKPKQFNNTDEPLDKVIRGKKQRRSKLENETCFIKRDINSIVRKYQKQIYAKIQ